MKVKFTIVKDIKRDKDRYGAAKREIEKEVAPKERDKKLKEKGLRKRES